MRAHLRRIRLEPSLSARMLHSSLRLFDRRVVGEASEIGRDLVRISLAGKAL